MMFPLLDLRPDPTFLENKWNWLWILLAVMAIIGLVVFFIRKRKKQAP